MCSGAVRWAIETACPPKRRPDRLGLRGVLAQRWAVSTPCGQTPRPLSNPRIAWPSSGTLILPIQRSAARRRQTNEPIFELVREGVVNALVHRDYAIEGAKCQLIVTPDTITVKSPGLPVEPITLEQMQSFKTPILSRNPVLHYVFARMELAEERGLGLRSMRARAEAAGLPLPRFAWEAPYLVLTLFRTAGAAIRALGEALLLELTSEERIGWSFLTGRTKATQSEYAQHLGVTARTAQRHLTHFVALGMLRRSGRGPATEYEVLP